MAVSLRPALLGAVAGAAVIATIAAVPASATPTTPSSAAGRAAVVGSVPAWATASAKVGAVNPHSVRNVEVALSPRDAAGAAALARAESTPGNPEYRHKISAAEYLDRFGPAQSTVDQVRSWLESQGLRVSGVSGNRALISASGKVDQLQAAFGVQLDTFHTTLHGTKRTLVAPTSTVTVPTALAGQVTAVLGLDDSDATITPAQAHVAVPAATPDASGTGCARSWGATNNTSVPQKYADQSNLLCGYLSSSLRGMYGLSAANTGAGTAVAIVGAYTDPEIVSDTNHAGADFGSPQLAPGQYQEFLPSSFTNNPNCNVDSWHSEQALDVQAIHTEAPSAQELYYAATDCTTLVNAFVQAVSADKASVISNSWTYTGESTVPTADRTAFENAAIQAADQGQTVLFATGDYGDNSTTAGTVEVNYPTTDPWVTAVGGTTTGLNASGQHVVLTGWEDAGETQNGSGWTPLPATQGGFAGGAGGGHSTLYAEPSYQSGVVPDGVSGGKRATPDISANADPFTGMAIGYTGPNGYVELAYGGTSEATPLIAGMVADAGQQVGNGGWLGFINPYLYKAGASAITDVTDQTTGVWTPDAPINGGGAAGSYLVDMGAKPQSLATTPGWDDVTGVGTPNGGFVAGLAAAANG